MASSIVRVKGFNVAIILLVSLWIAVLIFVVSSLMASYLTGTFTLMTAAAGVMMILVGLPLSVVIYLECPVGDFKEITKGLAVFIAVVTTSGIVMFVLPYSFNLFWLPVVGQLMWFAAYAAIFLPLLHSLRLHRKMLDRKVDVLFTAICLIAVLIVSLSVFTVLLKIPANGFNIFVYGTFVVFDIFLLSLLTKLLLINLPNMRRYFFTILFIFFLLNFLPDVLNLYTYLSLQTAVNVSYSNPGSLTIYSGAEVFLTIALLLYSSRNINPETVEEVRETLQDTRCMMNDLIAQSPDAICICDAGGNAITLNDTFTRVFQVGPPEPGGRLNLFDRSLAPGLPDSEFGRVKLGETVVLPAVQYAASGRYLYIKLYPTYTSNKTISGYVLTAEDITERMEAEGQIKDSLEEKKVLLKEIHHRVKNNLQIISSLLSIQASNIVDPTAVECLRDSRQRVKSMALIHEKLYQSENFSRVNFAEYTRSLADFLFRSYNVCPGNIRLDLQVEDLAINIDRAIPCGLIINELVSNSLKHAFPGDRRGVISIRMGRRSDRYELTVSDDGIGFPPEIDYRDTKSLGMQLISTLAAQLEGTVELDAGSGTRFTISFPAQATTASASQPV